jgi:hypothetical protein
MKNKQNEANNYNCVLCETGETETHGSLCSKIKYNNIINWIDERVKESVKFLDNNNTDYDSVLKNEDTEGYSEESENNNFEAGVISGLLELKKQIEENKL